ncbi:hypothetical protein D3C84_253310 [compost metagenome]
MSTSLDYFSRGLERAFARRKEQAKQQIIVEKVNNVAIESNAPTASVKQSDEQYRMTMIEKMTTLIHKRKTA